MKRLPLIHLNGESYAVGEPTKDIKSGYFMHPKNVLFPVTETYIKGPISTGYMKPVLYTTDKSLNLPLLPAVEEDINKIPYEVASEIMEKHWTPVTGPEILAYKLGYKAASKKKYSEEDMEAAVAFGITLERFKTDPHKLSDTEEFKGFIQSLNPLPIAIEVEMEDQGGWAGDFDERKFWMERLVPKVDKTNTIIGRYIYE